MLAFTKSMQVKRYKKVYAHKVIFGVILKTVLKKFLRIFSEHILYALKSIAYDSVFYNLKYIESN